MKSVKEIIGKFKPTDYKSQALALAKYIDTLCRQKGIEGHYIHVLNLSPKDMVEKLKMHYIDLCEI